MAGRSGIRPRGTATSWLSSVVRTEPSVVGTDVAVVALRVALVWIFLYYGAGKLFGAFGGPGIHATSVYMATTAHLRPGGFFAVLGGLIEFGGAVALAVGLGTRLAGLALVGDQVMAMITVTWAHGINSPTATGYEFNLALAAMALAMVGLGGGRLSLDAVIVRHLGSSGREGRSASVGSTGPDADRTPAGVVRTAR